MPDFGKKNSKGQQIPFLLHFLFFFFFSHVGGKGGKQLRIFIFTRKKKKKFEYSVFDIKNQNSLTPGAPSQEGYRAEHLFSFQVVLSKR